MTEAGRRPRRAAVLAVDGGNSKTDVVLVDRRGRVVRTARGPGSNHSQSDHASAMALIDSLVGQAVGGATAAVADVVVLCLAGADFPSDERRLGAAASRFGWADRVVVRNDGFAMLRAGTDSEVAVALVCGAGVNCVGVGPGGRTGRFASQGDISGDWGGGDSIGLAALGAAVRATDGRGPRTTLAVRVPRYFGKASPSALVFALYSGQIDQGRLVELPPLVFAAADDGDKVAIGIVDRQADELVLMAGAMLRRLRLTRADVDVVLGGGILTSGFQPLLDRVSAGITAVAPGARIVVLDTAAVTGAVLLGMDELGGPVTPKVRLAVSEALRTASRTKDGR